jgi:hypothetical protein
MEVVMRNRVVGICRGLFILAMAATLVITMGSLAQGEKQGADEQRL